MDLIRVGVIPHRKHRYPTCGDWRVRKKTIAILVSAMKNPDYVFLVALHELIEAWLCFRRGVREQDVTKFDMRYEKHRLEGDDSEPGDDPAAPYYREHQFASAMERMMAAELDVDWSEYDRTVASL